MENYLYCIRVKAGRAPLQVKDLSDEECKNCMKQTDGNGQDV